MLLAHGRQLRINGVDQFDSIFSGSKAVRHEVLLQLDPPARLLIWLR